LSSTFFNYFRGGRVKSTPVDNVTGKVLKLAMIQHVNQDAHIMTDEFVSYNFVKRVFPKHDVIKHRIKEYVRGIVHTNSAEGYFSLLKRGLNGTFHHVSRRHLFRYCDEFDFRYNLRRVPDANRAAVLLSCSGGKRLAYKNPVI
jgi:hypothetical protein